MGNKIVSPIECVVKHVTQAKQGQYKPFQSVLFIDDTGCEIWKSFALDAPELDILKPNLRVRLIPNGSSRNGKPSHVIELLDESSSLGTATVPPISATPSIMNNHQKRQVAAYIEQMGALYRFAYGQAAHHLKGMTDDAETLQHAASELFNAAQRKFDL